MLLILFYLTWVYDVLQTHLSDSEGMGILTQLLWQKCYLQLEMETVEPTASVSPPSPRTPTRRVPPREVVTEPPPGPPPLPPRWTQVGRASKPQDSPVSPKGLLPAQEVSVILYKALL